MKKETLEIAKKLEQIENRLNQLCSKSFFEGKIMRGGLESLVDSVLHDSVNTLLQETQMTFSLLNDDYDFSNTSTPIWLINLITPAKEENEDVAKPAQKVCPINSSSFGTGMFDEFDECDSCKLRQECKDTYNNSLKLGTKKK